MNATLRVIYNQDLFTYIASFAGERCLEGVYKNCLHSRHLEIIKYPRTDTLLYGQVQSGKTGKIIKYIKEYQPQLIKIIVIQNSLSMLSQYTKAFKLNMIRTQVITSKNIESCIDLARLRKIDIIVVMHNKFRMFAVDTFAEQLKTTNYNLILDESDQYFASIRNSKLYTHAFNTLHVTATPFAYNREIKRGTFRFTKLISLVSKTNYVGMNNITITPIFNLDKLENTTRIIQEDFITKTHGFMLINWTTTINDMKHTASFISDRHPNIPVVVISNKLYVYHNNTCKITNPTKVDVQKLVDKFDTNSHIIFIANRYSNRGINYTNSTYTRSITHQVSVLNGNATSFVQKCRIFGNKSDTDYVPNLFVMTKSIDNIECIKTMVSDAVDIIKSNKNEENEERTNNNFINMTITQLKQYCIQHNIRGYSNKRKTELIEHIQQCQQQNSTNNFNNMTIAQLKQYCIQHNITGYKNKRKTEIIEHIQQYVNDIALM
jgi:hypothetical protein